MILEVLSIRKSGYLTVYLSLILTIMISLCLTLIIGVRENTRRMQIECVTDIAMNNILAEYHQELLNQYDMFFIDTSYGSNQPDYQRTARHLEEYVRKNLGGDEILFSSILYRNLLKLSLDEVIIRNVSVSTDDNGAVFRRQAVDVMKQKIGLTYLTQLEKWLSCIEEYRLTELDIRSKEKETREQLESFIEQNGIVIEKEEEVLPGTKITSIWEKGILSLIVDDTATLSNQTINAKNYVSERERIKGTGLPNDILYEDSWLDQLFFHEYVLSYAGRYDRQKENSLLKYQVEYILGDKDNDLQNLRDMANKLLALRAAANFVHIVNDEEKMNVTKLAAHVLATLIMFPQIAPLFQILLVLVWTMAESIYDISQLFHGGRIELIKSKENWHYDLEQIFSFGITGEDEKETTGLSYADYLRIFLCFQDKYRTTFRLMNICEMDIRKTEGNQNFRIDGCIDSIEAELIFKSKDDKKYTIGRSYRY